MNTDNLRKIYSKHGLRSFVKSIEVLTSIDDILPDVFNKDKSYQDKFMQSINDVLEKYKTKAHL